MPWSAVKLRPGVDVQKTFSLNEAGVSQSQLLRYREGILEAYGGWDQYVNFPAGSTVRDLHAWQDISGNKHLASGATANLAVITSGSNLDITPQTSTTNGATFSITANTCTVTVVDANSSGLPSVYNTIFFNTPIALGGILLNGTYKIATVASSIIYTFYATQNATTTVSSGGTLLTFTTASGSPTITGTLPSNGFLSQTGLYYGFYAATSVAGMSISGPYQIASVIDSTQFTIIAAQSASATATSTQNGSNGAQLVYYVTIGPQTLGSGFGAGGFGDGGFGTGVSFTGTPGTSITTTDWTMDNWGEVLVACPKDGAIYTYSPTSGFTTAQVITNAPFFNGGIFISMPQQILVAWRSCNYITGTQDNLTVRWCNSGDFTNWTISNATTAGSFRIPTGSVIMGGIQGPNQGIIWTDVDVWAMSFIGGTLIFNFTRVGAGGLIAPHACGTIAGVVYWMGRDNFYILGPEGVVPVPCTVWDAVFQNLSSTASYVAKIYCATNVEFNEVAWFFPSATSTGENDSYVKYNIVEKEWDYGMMNRTAWMDVSVLGNPIGTDSAGTYYQHETGNVNFGANVPSFRSGWWAIAEGEELGFVDFVLPDFKFGTYSGSQNATMQVTFYSADYPGGAVTSYGPYTVTSNTEYITPRIRGRLMSIQVSGDGQTFWRLGNVRFRVASAGRR